MKSVYIGALLFCVVLIVIFSLLKYVVQTSESMAVVTAVVMALAAEWLYRKRRT